MGKRKARDPVAELLLNIDGAIKHQMQEVSMHVMSGKLPHEKDMIQKGIFEGLDRARTIIVATHKVWNQGEEEDDAET